MKKSKRVLRALGILMALLILGSQVTAGASEVEDTAEGTEAAAEETAVEQAEAEGEETAEATVDLNGTYTATLGIQTCNTLWITRFGYFNADIDNYYGTDKFSVLKSGSESSGNYLEHAGTFNDAAIAGNGTYTVSLTNADFAGEKSVSQLHIATNIPNNDQIRFTDVKVKINGKTVMTFDEGYMEIEDKFLAGGMVVLCFNNWRNELKKIVQDKGLYIEGSGIELLRGDGNDNIEITFTVSGFAYDKAEEPVAEEAAPAANDTNQPAETGDTTDEKSEDTAVYDAETEETGETDYATIIIIAVAVIAVIAVIAAVLLGKRKKE